jgi:hypothetical protein
MDVRTQGKEVLAWDQTETEGTGESQKEQYGVRAWKQEQDQAGKSERRKRSETDGSKKRNGSE